MLLLALALVAVIGYSGNQLWEIHQNNVQEAEIHNRLLQYRPTQQTVPSADTPIDGSTDRLADGSTDEPTHDAEANTEFAPHVNQSIVDLQEAISDVVGWLTVPNTQIDYPFAQGIDNSTYLHMDLDQRWSAAGTIFLDYRNSREFTDFNTILYGHHMRNGSMFGTLQQFNERAFFEANSTGTLFLADKTYEIEFIAFAVIQPDDAVVYNHTSTTEEGRVAFLEHIKTTARYYRDIDVTEHDQIITLSTCNYEFHNARMVLIGRLARIS